MRFRKKDEMNFIKVGLFLTLMTTILMVMIISIGKENSFFDSKVVIRAHVSNVKNLKNGSYVELKGIKVGAVSQIDIIEEDKVEILFTMLESSLKWLKKDSRVSISSAGLVGDKYLEILDGTKDAPAFHPEKDVLTSEVSGDFKQIMNKGESIATITERILQRIDLALVNLDDGRKISDIMSSMHESSLNLAKITGDLKEAELGAAIKNMNLSMLKLDRASGSMEKIISQIENGPGTLNSLIYDDGLHEDLRSLLGGASRNKIIKYYIRESIKNSERKKSQSER